MKTPTGLRNTGMVEVHTDDPELFWLGPADPHEAGSKYVPGIPARNLSGPDLDRAVYITTNDRHDDAGVPLGPIKPEDDGFDEAKTNLVGFLKLTGLYGDTAPKEEKPAASEPKAAPVESPAAPTDSKE